MLGYKKANVNIKGKRYRVLVVLQIPDDAQTVMPNETQFNNSKKKCRCSKAKVIKRTFTNGKTLPRGAKVFSNWDWDFHYPNRTIIQPSLPFNDNSSLTCASGIHFFQTRKEAVRYNFL